MTQYLHKAVEMSRTSTAEIGSSALQYLELQNDGAAQQSFPRSAVSIFNKKR